MELQPDKKLFLLLYPANMQRNADTSISTNDRVFIRQALDANCRLDGRQLYESRKVAFQFGLDDSSVQVSLGDTKVAAVITATLEAPYPDRPSEGSIRFNVECSPMASPAFEPGRPGPEAVQLARLVERALKQSGAVDCEALCVIAGRKVWSLRCDIHVLDHGGNLVDTCVLAGLAGLMAYRKPEVTIGGVTGTEVIVHSREQREPVPLTIHHTPVSVTWGLFQTPQSGTVCLVDPDLKEQAAADGSATFIVNTSDEVCGVHKASGLGLSVEETMRLIRLSCKQASSVISQLREALHQHDIARVAARVRRTQREPFPSSLSRHVTVSGAPGVTAPSAAVVGSALQSDDDSDTSDEDSEEQEGEDPAAHDSQTAAATTMQPADGSSKGRSTAPAHAKGQELSPTPAARLTPPTKAPSASKAKTSGKVAVPSEPPLSAPRPVTKTEPLDDNLETIAALIAGRQPSSGQTEGVLGLASAIKESSGKKKKKNNRGT